MDHNQVRDLGQQLRVDAVRAAAAAGSGHPTSAMSAAFEAAVHAIVDEARVVPT